MPAGLIATRFPGGVATSPPGWMFGDVPFPTQPYWYQYFNDFSTYASGDWTVTTGGTGTTALVDGVGGLIKQTTNNVDNDQQINELKKKSFFFTSGQDVAFCASFEASAVAGSTGPDLFFGLGDTFANGSTGPTDGVWFNKAQNSTTLNLLVTNTSTSTTIPVGTVAAATRYTVGFVYRGSAATPTLTVFSTIPYAAGTVTQPSPYWPGGNNTAAMAFSGGTYTLANLPATTTGLTMGFGIQAGTTAAQTLTLDYIYAGQSIARY